MNAEPSSYHIVKAACLFTEGFDKGRQDEIEAASAACDEALKSESSNFAVWLLKNVILDSLGRKQEAAGALYRANQLHGGRNVAEHIEIVRKALVSLHLSRGEDTFPDLVLRLVTIGKYVSVMNRPRATHPIKIGDLTTIPVKCPECGQVGEIHTKGASPSWWMQLGPSTILIPAECPYCRIGMMICVKDNCLVSIEPFDDTPEGLLSAIEETKRKLPR
jgi:hypothetical protein